MDGITHITMEAITTNTITEGITTDISIAGTTIGTAAGLSASMGVQGIIAIGKRITTCAGWASNLYVSYEMRRFCLFKLLVPRIIAHWNEPIKLSDDPEQYDLPAERGKLL